VPKILKKPVKSAKNSLTSNENGDTIAIAIPTILVGIKSGRKLVQEVRN